MDRRIELYKSVGEALHLAQVLELHISTLISILRVRFDVDIDQDKLILREDKKTLGKLLDELKKHGNLDEDGIQVFQNALAMRNYIAHHFFNRNVYAFSDQESFNNAIDSLKDGTKTIAAATALAQGFVEGFCRLFNLKLSDIVVRQD